MLTQHPSSQLLTKLIRAGRRSPDQLVPWMSNPSGAVKIFLPFLMQVPSLNADFPAPQSERSFLSFLRHGYS